MGPRGPAPNILSEGAQLFNGPTQYLTCQRLSMARLQNILPSKCHFLFTKNADFVKNLVKNPEFCHCFQFILCIIFT